MPHATGGARRIISAQIELSPAEHQRLLRIAANHERSARAEARWAVRQWLDQHDPINGEDEDTAS
jgi:plasmid stability protein